MHRATARDIHDVRRLGEEEDLVLGGVGHHRIGDGWRAGIDYIAARPDEGDAGFNGVEQCRRYPALSSACYR